MKLIEAISNLLWLPWVALAQDVSGGGLFNPLGDCDLPCIVDEITTLLIAVGGPIAAIMVLWGGFQIMTAAGDPEKFATGRKTILYAAVGLVVILFAKGVVSFIRSIFS